MWDYTNYENQVKHLEAAGLNPALLYGQGGGGGATAAGGAVGNGQGTAATIQQRASRLLNKPSKKLLGLYKLRKQCKTPKRSRAKSSPILCKRRARRSNRRRTSARSGTTIYNANNGKNTSPRHGGTITKCIITSRTQDRKSTRLNSSHRSLSRMPSSA